MNSDIHFLIPLIKETLSQKVLNGERLQLQSGMNANSVSFSSYHLYEVRESSDTTVSPLNGERLQLQSGMNSEIKITYSYMQHNFNKTCIFLNSPKNNSKIFINARGLNCILPIKLAYKS